MAWFQSSDRPLSEPVVAWFAYLVCVGFTHCGLVTLQLWHQQGWIQYLLKGYVHHALATLTQPHPTIHPQHPSPTPSGTLQNIFQYFFIWNSNHMQEMDFKLFCIKYMPFDHVLNVSKVPPLPGFCMPSYTFHIMLQLCILILALIMLQMLHWKHPYLAPDTSKWRICIGNWWCANTPVE